MAEQTTSAAEALRSFCQRLRRLRLEAGGPSVESLARNETIPLGRSQLYAVLNGEVKEPPPWDFVRPFVIACRAYAAEHGNLVSVPVELAYWRADANAVEELHDAERHHRRRPEEPAPDPAAMESLPPDVATFVGRDAETAALLAAQPGTSTAPAVYLISGMAGVGKTTIAVHVAHQLADRYPDGRLYLNLYGHRRDRTPLTADHALSVLLEATGIPSAAIPTEHDARVAIWRHQTHRKRLVLVFDDASDAAQLEPLLPAAAGSLVLITSRNRLPALVRARPLNVDTLPAGEAYKLFLTVADRDLGTQDEAIQAVVARCGNLPLAVSLVAARLRMHPAWSAEHLLATLPDHGDQTPADAIQAAFDASYEALDEPHRQAFRRLSGHPGADIDAWAAAAILDTNRRAARDRLEHLYARNLLEEASQDRYRLHDLLRDYATERNSSTERSQAQRRLLNYYLAVAGPSGSFYAIRPDAPNTPDMPGPTVDSYESATRWLSDEMQNIASCVIGMWGEHPREVVALSAAAHPYLRHTGPWDLVLQVHDAALQAARLVADRATVATALLHYGIACMLADRAAAASAALRESFDLSDDPLLRADALTSLGMTLRFGGDYAAATAVLTDAIGIFTELDDANGKAAATTSLAVTARLAGDYRSAYDIAATAVEASRRSTYLPGRVSAFGEFGVTQYLLGQYAEAAATLGLALDLARGLDNPLSEATALNYLGAAQYLSGEVRAAIGTLGEALELFHRLGERLGSADALSQLGVAHGMVGEYETAATLQRQAIDEFRDLDHRLGVAVARNELGAALLGLGQTEQARTEIISAVEVLRELDYKPGLEEALNNLGRTELSRGRPFRAFEHHTEALGLAVQSGIALAEARSNEGIGRCLAVQARSSAAAYRHLHAALAVYDEVGSSQAEAIRRDFPALAETAATLSATRGHAQP